MPRSTVTSKGQVTIPIEIREALHLQPGVRVTFLMRPDGVIELRPETVDLRSLIGSMRVEGRKLSVEEMNEVVRRRPSGR